MPGEQPEKAGFVRVSDSGDLVFSVGGRQFSISVDDTLERAILEAKQVRSEKQRAPQPHQQATLPISQIQSLIRAGADPARVAERYHLSETLVRRFSAAVETEKQYAIEQFLTVPAPKDSRVRTISELVERTLASASIGMESVTWKSTRRGLEPWRIVAIFTSAGREIHAEWTWNMHDNSVVCLNNAARKLLGEQNPGSPAADSGLRPVTAELPGDSVRSARIERAVSAWAAPIGSAPASHPTDAQAGATAVPGAAGNATPVAGGAAGGAVPSSPTGSMPPIDFATTGSMPAISPTTVGAANEGSPAAPGAVEGITAAPATSTDETKTAENTTPAKPAKRRSGRSAVPSWDEILFGD
ncbi:septation protein SepH [Bifidobacterium miconisargentati]|uniref:septation protein SepH n=1 Tax=Bifidobacterium miconisargentati TaxID=2834437 RepID=UPI001BDD6FAC|nr:septation protein SepH [Bifidobacterium miconisargentati]MBW3090712.1 DUF3071 domain-containing protein [Bifidobacterium miconisargentati]